jgi:hypothetical protein
MSLRRSGGNVNHYPNKERGEGVKRITRRESTGLCLGCGGKLTFCGVPFTADILCRKCNTINVYKDSQQPVSKRP